MYWLSDSSDELYGGWPGMLDLPPGSSDDPDSSEEIDSSEVTDSSEEPGSSEEVDSSGELPIKKKRKKESPGEQRNWLELPRDVMILIFLKLGVVDILMSAQSVCSAWRKLSKEPQLFRSIDMRDRYWDLYEEIDMEKLTREAVNRSRGQLVEFSVEYFPDNWLLHYITLKSCSLRVLRLVSCYQCGDDGLILIAKKCPMLEELEICHHSFSKEAFEVVGQVCPQLKYFRLNASACRRPRIEYDEEALAIAKNMPQLRRLHLFGNKMTNNGLKAILDGCPHLEYLDLRQCLFVKLEGDLLKRCTKIRKLRLPEDPPDDYEFDPTILDGGAAFD